MTYTTFINEDHTIINILGADGIIKVIEPDMPEWAEVIKKAKPYIPPTEEETNMEKAQEIRLKRGALLAASDWTQVSDAPVDQSAWATYRQALRDVTKQAGFPDNVAWPIKP